MIIYTGYFKAYGAKTVQLICSDGWVSGKHRSHQDCYEDRRRYNATRRKATTSC